MSIQIKYNNNDPFINVSPYPFVEKSVEMVKYGENWCQLDKIKLNGQITGKCANFQEMVNRQKRFISGFAQDFKTLEIYQDNNVVYSKKFAKITNISFDSSSYVGIIPYSLDLECYPEEFFDGKFGVLEPSETVSYSENEDGILEISHNISAKGFNTNSNYSNALENAKGFVQQRTGYISNILPAFIKYCYINPCLKSQSESIDRLNAVYSVEEKYTTDLKYSGVGILRYTADYSSGIQNGISAIDIKGSIDGCRNQTIASLRQRYYDFDAYSTAIVHYSGIANAIDLNPTPLSSGISEDTINKKINFDISFDNDKMPKTIFSYSASFEYDYLTDYITASIQGNISSKSHLKERWSNVLSYYSGVNLYSLLLPKYVEYANSIQNGLGNYPLNPNATSSGVSFNEYTAEIGLNATYTSRPTPPDGFSLFEYSMNFVPSINQYSNVPCLDGQGTYTVFDLNYANRALLSMNIQSIKKENIGYDEGVSRIKNEVNYLRNKYFQGQKTILESQSISKSNKSFENNINCSASFSCQQSTFSI